MPKVGKKKFAYTKAGKKKAKSYAKKKERKLNDINYGRKRRKYSQYQK